MASMKGNAAEREEHRDMEEMQRTAEQIEEEKKRDEGKLFRPQVFLSEMFAARDRCAEYEKIPYARLTDRQAFIKELFGHTGKDPMVENGFKCDTGRNISVGDNFYCNFNCTIYDSAQVTIGDNVMFGPSVTVCTASHPLKISERLNEDGAELAFPVRIGNNVWVGGGAFINPGVTIGDGAVIASGAVVTKDVPANVLAAGVPARVKKYIANYREGFETEVRTEGGTRVERFEKDIPLSEYMKDHVDPAKFLGFCKECSNYGKNWSCSPFDFDPMQIWNAYSLFKVITYRFYPEEGMDTKEAEELNERLKKAFIRDVSSVERSIPGSLSLFAGTCSLCAKCAKESGEKCRFPEKMRHSIESIGGDVGKTIKDFFNIDIKWGTKDSLPEYYVLCGGVLIRN